MREMEREMEEHNLVGDEDEEDMMHEMEQQPPARRRRRRLGDVKHDE